MICYPSVHDCWLFVLDIVRNVILLHCFVKSTILFELLYFEVKFKICEVLHGYEIEICIQMCVFRIIMNTDNPLSLVSMYLVALRSKMNQEQEG